MGLLCLPVAIVPGALNYERLSAVGAAAVLREARSRPVAVLNHNKAAFYMIEPALFEAMIEGLGDQQLHRKVLARLDERARAIEVDVDEI